MPDNYCAELLANHLCLTLKATNKSQLP